MVSNKKTTRETLTYSLKSLQKKDVEVETLSQQPNRQCFWTYRGRRVTDVTSAITLTLDTK